MSRAGPVDEKATRRNNGVIRMELPESRPAARVDRPSTGKVSGMRRTTMGDAAAAVFPQTTRAWRSSDADAGAAYAKGDVARAIGASARKIATVPAGLAYDAVVPAISGIWNGGGRVLGGVLGSDGSTAVNKAYTPPAPAASAVAANALAAGAAAPQTPLTPQELMLAHLDTLLSRPMTQRGAQAVSGMLPAPAKQLDAKDTVLDTTAQASKSVYDSQIKSIIDQRSKGTLDQAAAQDLTAKATTEYINRNSALLGNNLLTMAQAGLMPAPKDEDE